MKICFYLIFLLITNGMLGQVGPSQDGVVSYNPQNGIRVEEVPPVWEGCSGNLATLKSCFNQKLSDHIATHFIIPYETLQRIESHQITVLVRFTKKGKVSVRKIKGGIPKIQEIARNTFDAIPAFTPGTLGGKNIHADYTIPISY